MNTTKTLRDQIESRFVTDFRANKFLNELTQCQNPFKITDYWLSELRSTLDASIKEIGGMVMKCGCGSVNFEHWYEGEVRCIDCDKRKTRKDGMLSSDAIGYNSAVADILTRLEAQRDLLK